MAMCSDRIPPDGRAQEKRRLRSLRATIILTLVASLRRHGVALPINALVQHAHMPKPMVVAARRDLQKRGWLSWDRGRGGDHYRITPQPVEPPSILAINAARRERQSAAARPP